MITVSVCRTAKGRYVYQSQQRDTALVTRSSACLYRYALVKPDTGQFVLTNDQGRTEHAAPRWAVMVLGYAALAAN